MDEQFIQAHAQCMTHPKKPVGKPLADKVSAKRSMASFFNGVWAKPPITAFSAKSLLRFSVCGWLRHDFGPHRQHSTLPYLVAQVIKGFAAELRAFDDKLRWFLKSE